MAGDLVPPPVAEWPTARPGGIKIACPLCLDATGYLPPSQMTPVGWWTRRHDGIEHVRCECGVIRTPSGMSAHLRSKRHQEWESAQEASKVGIYS